MRIKKILILAVLLTAAIQLSCFSQNIKVLTLKDCTINPVTAEYIISSLKKAENQDCLAVIIRLHTPGGLLKSTQDITASLLNSRIPVITYVWPKGSRAASAGTFIGYASTVLAMAPSTHIGAAHPVIGGGSWGKMPEEVKEKILNDTLAWAKNISDARKRPYQFLKDAIEKSVSLTEQEALKKGAVDFIAQDIPELLAKMEGKKLTVDNKEITFSAKDAKIEYVELSRRQNFLNTILDPNIAYLLFTLGFLGLIFEVTHPGFGFPGIAGIICIILAFYAFSVLPVNYAGLGLITLGIVFFIVEAFTPTFGLFTLGGVIAFILGSVLLFREPKVFTVPLKTILPLVIMMAAFSFFILTKALQLRLKKPATGVEGLIGKHGKALTLINRKGKISAHGEIWTAKSKQKIKKGKEVTILKIQGLVLEVEEKKKPDNNTA